MTTLQILQRAYNRITENGWTRYSYRTGDGSYCAVGAIAHDGVKSVEWIFSATAIKAFGKALIRLGFLDSRCEYSVLVGGIGTILDWNDDGHATQDKVRRALAYAIGFEEAREKAAA